VKIKVINRSKHPLPSYQTKASAGVDIRANIDESIELSPLARVLIPTGLFLEIPPGYECQVRPRSGLALKQGLTLLNTPGTIDSDYRGEIGVIIINLSAESQTINDGDRIAQLVFAQYQQVEFNEVEQLTPTTRSVGGFGSTGIH